MSNLSVLKIPVFIVSLVLASMSTSVAMASGGGESKEAADPYVKLASVAIPVFEGSVVQNYIFLTVKLNLSPKADVTKLREKEPVFRDRLMKAAYKTSFGTADRNDTLDEPRFKKAMMTELSAVSGPGMIQSIEILNQNPRRRQR